MFQVQENLRRMSEVCSPLGLLCWIWRKWCRMFEIQQDTHSPQGRLRWISCSYLVAYGCILAAGSLLWLLLETDFTEKISGCLRVKFQGCVKYRTGRISHLHALGIASGYGVEGLGLYLLIALSCVYGKRMHWWIELEHCMNGFPKLKLVLTCLSNFIMNMLVNIFCARLAVFFKHPVDTIFAVMVQLSHLCFLVAGLTTMDLGFSDLLSALALSGMSVEGLWKWIGVCSPGSLKQIVVPLYIYNFGEKRALTWVRELTNNALDKADSAVVNAENALEMLQEIALQIEQQQELLLHAAEAVKNSVEVTKRKRDQIATIGERLTATITVEEVASEIKYAFHLMEETIKAASRATASVEFAKLIGMQGSPSFRPPECPRLVITPTARQEI